MCSPTPYIDFERSAALASKPNGSNRTGPIGGASLRNNNPHQPLLHNHMGHPNSAAGGGGEFIPMGQPNMGGGGVGGGGDPHGNSSVDHPDHYHQQHSLPYTPQQPSQGAYFYRLISIVSEIYSVPPPSLWSYKFKL